MYLIDYETPSYKTFGNFINEELSDSIEEIFKAVNEYIFEIVSLFLHSPNVLLRNILADTEGATSVKKRCGFQLHCFRVTDKSEIIQVAVPGKAEIEHSGKLCIS